MMDETDTKRREASPRLVDASPQKGFPRKLAALAPNPPTTETAEPLALETQRGAKGRREAAFPSFRFMALGYALLVVMIFSLMASYSEWFAVYKGAAELKALALLCGLGFMSIWINVNVRGALIEWLPWDARLSSIIEQAIYATVQMIVLTFISGALIMAVWAPKIQYSYYHKPAGIWPDDLANPALAILILSASFGCGLLTIIGMSLTELHNIAVRRSLNLSESTASFAPPPETTGANTRLANAEEKSALFGD